jgi:hypothetical protein
LVPLDRAIENRPRAQPIGIGQRFWRAVLLADQGFAIDLHRPCALLPDVPVPISGDNGVMALAGRHHRVDEGRHAGIDAVALACIVATDASQRLAGGRGAAGLDRLYGLEPLLLALCVEVSDR